MRLALSLLLGIPGLILLATSWLPLGAALMLAAWWIYERSGLPGDDDALIHLLMFLGALGAGWQFVVYLFPRLG